MVCVARLFGVQLSKRHPMAATPLQKELRKISVEYRMFRLLGQLSICWGVLILVALALLLLQREWAVYFPYALPSLALLGAHAAGVPAIETVYPDFRDEVGLAAYAARGRRDGFAGMMAIHPAQVAAINAAFTPSEEEIAHARAVVAAFAANPGAGALQMDGRMIDAPHLKAAERLLARVG